MRFSKAFQNFWSLPARKKSPTMSIYETQYKSSRMLKALLWRSLLMTTFFLVLAPFCFAQEGRARVGYSAMSGSMAWVWAAKEGGYFDQHGLKVDLIYIGGSAQLFQSMLSGEIAFGVGGGPSIINVNSQRTSIVAIEGTLN